MRGILKGGALGILKHRNLKNMDKFFKNTWEVAQSSRFCTEADSDPCQTSKIELLENIVNGFQPSIIFVKTSLFDFLQGLWIYPHFKYKIFLMNFSYIVVIVERIQNALLVLLAMAELIVCVMVSSNKIQTVTRSNKGSWNWTMRSLKLWDLNKRQIRNSHRRCSMRKGCS